MKQQVKFKQTEIGKIPEDWEVGVLADHIEIIGGGTPKTTVKGYWNGNIPWISIVDFEGDKRWIYDTEKHITNEGLDNSATKLLHKNQLIISARGTVGELGQVTKDMAFNQSCYGINGKKEMNNNYLYYLLKQKVKEFQQKGHGAVFNTITTKTFSQIIIPLLSLPEQHSIAKILSDLDTKIELNNQMNKTLEAIGQALFKKWFVDEKKDEWKEGRLGDYVNIIKGVSYRSDELKESDKALVTLKSMNRGGGLNKNGFKEYIGECKKEQEIVDGDIVVAYTDLTQKADVIGRPAIVRTIIEYKTLIASLDLAIIRPKNEQTNNQFLYYLLGSEDFQGHVQGFTNGTTVLHLSSKAIPEYILNMPNKELILKFGSVINPLLNKKRDNEAQSEFLIQIRDALLPKLMSGEIRTI